MENIEAIREKLSKVLECGLVKGVGDPEPGKFCAEAAVCYVLGEPHGDKPSCVHEVDRSLVIRLNDDFPGTDQERANALRHILLAHLGTAGKDRAPWVSRIALEVVRIILPLALEAAAAIHPQEVHSVALRAQAKVCAEVTNDRAALLALDAADAAANAARAAADAAANAARAAANAAAYAARAAANVAANVAANAVAYAARAAADAARAAADAANSANAAADAAQREVYNRFITIVREAYEAEGRGGL